MNNKSLNKYESLCTKYIEEYLASSHLQDTPVSPSSSIPSLDKNNVPVYGLDYFDLMMVYVVLSHHNDCTLDIDVNYAELISRLAYDGLRHLGIFTDAQAKEFCNDLAVHRIPKRTFVYQYLMWILRYPHNVLPHWFYYTLLLFAFTRTKSCPHRPDRSRMVVGMLVNYSLSKFTDYEADRTQDVFDIGNKLKRAIKACDKIQRYKTDYVGYVEYMIDTLRLISVATLSSMLKRSCKWEEFTRIGLEVASQMMIEHNKIVNDHYTQVVERNLKHV